MPARSEMLNSELCHNEELGRHLSEEALRWFLDDLVGDGHAHWAGPWGVRTRPVGCALFLVPMCVCHVFLPVCDVCLSVCDVCLSLSVCL